MMPEEARTKWCPHTRTPLVQGMAVNRTVSMSPDGRGYVNVHDETRCIGPDCMMWQWHVKPDFREERLLSTTDGYCGLAGDGQ